MEILRQTPRILPRLFKHSWDQQSNVHGRCFGSDANEGFGLHFPSLSAHGAETVLLLEVFCSAVSQVAVGGVGFC